MSDKLRINLEIIPEMIRLPLNIDPKDEPVCREAAKFVREKFNQYRQRFDAKVVSDLDVMAMVALQTAKDALTLEKQNEIAPLKERVSRMNEELKKYLIQNNKA